MSGLLERDGELRAIGELVHHAGAGQGERERARLLALEELELARRFDAPRSVGIALLAVAATERGGDAVAVLHEAVHALAHSADRLEHARALCALGRALRHTRQPRAARAPLRQALDLATRAGAEALAADARSELLATGARPRRASPSGRDALTPAEQRVAGLAADGLSNREIAQTLFVTTSTVEAQLRQAFRKLGIASRDQLASAVDAGYEDVA